jgi:UDP-N-acetylglucosamine 2-epimerase (non-hydrolysing)
MPIPEVHLVGGACTDGARLAPVAMAVHDQGRLTPVLVAAGGDPVGFAQALAVFDLAPGLAVPAGTDQAEMTRRLDELWATRTPAAVLVQGDGESTLAAAVAACWRRIPVVHLDAGRRSGDLGSSTVAEANRRLLTQLATVHLAAAPLAAMNLLDEGVAGGDVLLTGNTSVDAALALAGRRLPFTDTAVAAARTDSTNRLILVSVEHAEGDAAARVAAAVRRLVASHPDLDVIVLGGGDVPTVNDGVTVTGFLPYPDRARLLSEAYLILTDDSDRQEEALAFGAPALVLHDTTEQAESLYTGCARLVGTDTDAIVTAASALLDSRVRRDAMIAGGNPYGDGLAARRVAQAIAALLGHGSFPDPMPARHACATR